MEITRFSARALKTDYPHGLHPDHVFVISDSGNNWNCFGRGAHTPNALNESLPPLVEGSAHAKWASLIYGPYEGRQDNSQAALLIEKHDGVCHNVANRILVLAGDDVDVRRANGNALAILMYGKFGFNIPEYMDLVASSAEKIMRESPESLSESEVEAVIKRITHDLSANEELEILESALEEQLKTQFELFTVSEKEQFMKIYKDFQQKRTSAFDAESRSTKGQDIQEKFRQRLQPHLKKCLFDLSDLLGAERFKTVFHATPEIAMSFLLLG